MTSATFDQVVTPTAGYPVVPCSRYDHVIVADDRIGTKISSICIGPVADHVTFSLHRADHLPILIRPVAPVIAPKQVRPVATDERVLTHSTDQSISPRRTHQQVIARPR
ncbi:hypothetical protein D9M69_386180 [compost metagenome]